MNGTNGRPIPGTSVHNAQPDCNPDQNGRIGHSLAGHYMSSGGRRVQSKPWRKCPANEKLNFQRNLMDLMTSVFVRTSPTQTETLKALFEGENANLKIEERVAKWQFMEMDRNKDKVNSKVPIISQCSQIQKKGYCFNFRQSVEKN